MIGRIKTKRPVYFILAKKSSDHEQTGLAGDLVAKKNYFSKIGLIGNNYGLWRPQRRPRRSLYRDLEAKKDYATITKLTS
jgi:hypothetical protein